MLRVNVGISRKMSKDYNSTGFTLNLDGEITANLDDPETVIARIREFYDLADEALQDQISRHQEIDAVANRETAALKTSETSGQSTTSQQDQPQPGNGHGRGNEEPATNKQVQFMLTVGKRQGMSKPQLENRIAQILGRRHDLYELSKRDAGIVLNTLTEQ